MHVCVRACVRACVCVYRHNSVGFLPGETYFFRTSERNWKKWISSRRYWKNRGKNKRSQSLICKTCEDNELVMYSGIHLCAMVQIYAENITSISINFIFLHLFTNRGQYLAYQSQFLITVQSSKYQFLWHFCLFFNVFSLNNTPWLVIAFLCVEKVCKFPTLQESVVPRSMQTTGWPIRMTLTPCCLP